MSKKLTHEEYLERLNERRNDLEDYVILTKYKTTADNITVRHKCGETYDIPAKHFLRGDGCFKCSYIGRIHNKRTTEEVKKELSEMTNCEYKLLSEYVNNKQKVTILHLECNRTFEMTYNKFKSSKRRCPHCNISNGEVAIEKYLLKKEIKHKREVSFVGCKYKRSLRFDFYLEDYNTVIEFDGKQHFEPSFGSNYEKRVAYLEETQLRDKIKTEFCEKEGIKLIRINYKDINKIEEILDKYF